MERAEARICREAGARVTTNTLLTDLNIPSLHRLDQRRIEVIATGLPLYHGAQIAVDTILVSPLTASSQPRRRQGTFAGLHWQMPGVPRNETTQSLSNPIAATSSSSASKWAADSATDLPGSFDSWQQHGHDQSQLPSAHRPQRLLFLGGLLQCGRCPMSWGKLRPPQRCPASHPEGILGNICMATHSKNDTHKSRRVVLVFHNSKEQCRVHLIRRYSRRRS